MQVDPLVSKLNRRYQDLSNARSNWERHWQELADYMLPRKADITKKRTEGDKRVVDTVYRKFKMTARAMEQQFGPGNLPTAVVKDAQNEPFKEHEIIHAVYPRGDVAGKGSKRKPIASIYYHKGTKALLSEGGFDDFPFMVPRFVKDSVSIYGRSPAMTALPDVKMLNKMSETTIRAAQKQVDPPLMAPDDGFMLPIRTTPGSLNFYRAGTRDRLEPLQIGANNPLGLNMEEQRRQAIRQAFYVDQLLLAQGQSMTATEVLQRMTATEVLQRNEEKMRMLGPVLGRLQSELLQPLISRAFALLLRSGQLPPAPEELQGQDIDIEYVSPLAKAQKLTDLQSMLRGFEVMMQVAEIAPVMDYLDTDRLVQYLVEVTGIPARVIRSDEEVARIRRQAAQAAQAQQQQQAVMMESEVAKNVAPFVKATGMMPGAQG